MKSSTWLRLSLTVFVLGIWYILNSYIRIMATPFTGEASVLQLNSSDADYAKAMTVMHYYPSNGLSIIILLGILLLIWWKPVKSKFFPAIVTGLIGAGLFTTPSFAFYERNNNPEFVEIGNNQSAFLIPVTGDNVRSQAQFGSVEYLNQPTVKVPMKRIEIPHVLIHNPGITTSDYWVPSSKLIIVDRAPYQRIWSSKGSGTNANVDESMHSDTADGVNFWANITIGASIKEEDTALFLYNFPTKNLATGSATASSSTEQLQAIFSSVSYGSKLSDIMDTIVWAATQAEFNATYGSIKLSDLEAKKSATIKIVEKNIQEMFAKKGITILFLGLASGINYDNAAIQKAMDDLVIADMRVAETAKLVATIAYQKDMAAINLTNASGTALQKWNGVAPALPTVMGSETLANLVAGARALWAGTVSGSDVAPQSLKK